MKKIVTLVIPTRSICDVTLNNLQIISELNYFEKFDLFVVIVTNNIYDLGYEKHLKDSIKILHNEKMNAAISRNIGIENSRENTNSYIFLDDDIVFDVEKTKILFESLEFSPEKTIFAPYIEGHYIATDYMLNPVLCMYYSWIFGYTIKSYGDIQGKTAFGLTFPPLFSSDENLVQWIPGGCMIFNQFEKKEVFFDERIFCTNYQLEDFYLSHSLFLKGYEIKMIPISLNHNTSFQKKSKYTVFKRHISVEKNRKLIFEILKKNKSHSIFKFQVVLFMKAFYNLKNFNFDSFSLFLSTLYVILWKNRKFLLVL